MGTLRFLPSLPWMYKPSSFSRSSEASGVPAIRDRGESSIASVVPRDDRFLVRRLTPSAVGASDEAREATLSFRRTLPFLLRLLSLLGFTTPFAASRRSFSFINSAPLLGTVRLRRLLPMLSALLCATGTARSAVLVLNGRAEKS